MKILCSFVSGESLVEHTAASTCQSTCWAGSRPGRRRSHSRSPGPPRSPRWSVGSRTLLELVSGVLRYMVYTKIPPPPEYRPLSYGGVNMKRGTTKGGGGIWKKKEERGKTKPKLGYTEKFEADYSIFPHHVNLQENVSTLQEPPAQYTDKKAKYQATVTQRRLFE